MRVAALYDIHGHLPALEAVLSELERLEPDIVVVGGDVASGPMPAETLERLAAMRFPARFVRGNADRAVVAAYDGEPTADDPAGRSDAWTAARITRPQRDALAAYEPTVTIDGVLYCHGSPRSDEEIITAVTPPERLARILAGVQAPLVICGHTHHQFRLGRVVNAGSVGMPYQGAPGAYWALVDGRTVDLRWTGYDVDAAAAAIRATGYPEAEDLVRETMLEPVEAGWVARHFEERAGAA